MDSTRNLIIDTGRMIVDRDDKIVDQRENKSSSVAHKRTTTAAAEGQNIELINNISDLELITDINSSSLTIDDFDASVIRTDNVTKSNKETTVNDSSNSILPTVISSKSSNDSLNVPHNIADKLSDTPGKSDKGKQPQPQQSEFSNTCDTDLNDKSIEYIEFDQSQLLKHISKESIGFSDLRTTNAESDQTTGTNEQIHLESINDSLLTNEADHISDSSSNFDSSHQTLQLDERHLLSDRSYSPSYVKRFHHSRTGGLLSRIKQLGNNSSLGWFVSKSSGNNGDNTFSSHSHSEDKDLLTGASKYSHLRKRRQNINGRTFWGSYRYKRIGIVMAIFKKLQSFILSRSTLALFGAFLIHITLGTVYTLSNINSYLTSYMRKHGTPDATYGGSMWISSSYAVGQGFSMVLGGYIAKRFSARLSCIIGCILHSGSIMSTSVSIDYGRIPVLITYGLLPGFGCGLAYMTPMTNGFGWFPNRKGLVAGTILAGFGIGTFVFNMAQTAYVNPQNLSPPKDANGYFTQEIILKNVPHLFTFIGSIYASMQFIGCCLLFKPPNDYHSMGGRSIDEKPILVETEIPLKKAIRSREFLTLFFVFGLTNQGVLFVNSMLKEYGQIFIGNDMYLAWTGSMASIANSLGRLVWGMAIDRYSFTCCFTAITFIFGSLMFIMPFEFILSSKLWYLLCTLGIFGSFSGWMSTYPVHISRVFGVTNSGMVYGLIFVSQAFLAIFTALGAHYLIDHYSRFVPFFCVTFLEVLGLAIYHLFYEKRSWN